MMTARTCRPMPFALLVAVALAGCHTTSPAATTTAINATTWIRTDLYFGLTRRDSSEIPPEAWNDFVDRVITPEFPDGLTVTPAAGQYRDSRGVLHKEPSRILTLLFPAPDAPGDRRKIALIAAEYCRRFDQESVLCTEAPVQSEFVGANPERGH